MLEIERWEVSEAIRPCASHLNLDYPLDKTESEATSVYGLQRLLVNRSKACGDGGHRVQGWGSRLEGSSRASLDVKSVVLPHWVMLPIVPDILPYLHLRLENGETSGGATR